MPLVSVTFESVSRLMQLGSSAFRETGLSDIVIPSSVEVISPCCFFCCRSLVSLTFE
jgi:hypothetical protein